MTTLKDLLVQELTPQSTNIPVSCGQCAHFKKYPAYRINGRMTVCRHPDIGRVEDDIPCPNFSLDTNFLQDLEPDQRDTIIATLKTFGFQNEKLKRKDRQELERTLHSLSLYFYALATGLKKDLRLGVDYSVGDITGQLVSWDPALKRAILKTQSGINYTVDVKSLSIVE